MIDIHHHLLPALDDGSVSLETSVLMVEAAVADGISRIVCTPHASHHWRFDPAVNAAKLAELKAVLPPGIEDRIQFGLGCDFHLSHENIEDALAHPTKYTINGGQYLLVELPDFGFSANMRDVFYNLRMAGMIPILTHPERNPTLIEKPDRMIDWLRDGLLVQITANSLTGRFGKICERMAHQLLSDQWVHFIATDAHNTQSRPPLMRQACEIVAKKYGDEAAQRLCVANPLAVFEDRQFPEQPEPKRVFDEEEGRAASWWRRLFRS